MHAYVFDVGLHKTIIIHNVVVVAVLCSFAHVGASDHSPCMPVRVAVVISWQTRWMVLNIQHSYMYGKCLVEGLPLGMSILYIFSIFLVFSCVQCVVSVFRRCSRYFVGKLFGCFLHIRMFSMYFRNSVGILSEISRDVVGNQSGYCRKPIGILSVCVYCALCYL